MAAAGKKGKKAKWIKANLTDIIAEPTTIPTTQSWAEAAEEEPENYGHSTHTRAPVVLPSASRAACGGMAVDEDSIPHRPPFVAHVSNLPYDVDESAIAELFEGLKLVSLRIPREGDRLKGFGYVDFENREDLITAMKMTDPIVGGRRIRIDVSTTDSDRRMGRSGGRNDREREYDPERTMGDWRSGPRAAPEPSRPRPAGDRDRDRDRDHDRERPRDSSADNKPGGWRDGDRPAPPEPARTPYGGRDSFGRDRYDDRDRGRERGGYGGRDGFRAAERDEGRGFGNRDRGGFGGRGGFDRERDPPPREEAAKPRERPKLNLLPRTVPREEPPPPPPAAAEPERAPAKPLPKEKVFGSAKPVDTAAKEREIEERLRKQEEEARRGADDKERWVRKNDHSGDRRAAPRRDDRDRDRDRPRDSRSYNRERREYSPRRNSRRGEREPSPRRGSSHGSRERRDSPERRRRESPERRRRESPERRRRESPERRRRESPERRRRDSPERRHRDSPERRRGDSPERRRRDSPEPRHRDTPPASPERRPPTNGDAHERPLPKLKEHEKPNFVGANKFSFLEAADDDGGSD